LWRKKLEPIGSSYLLEEIKIHRENTIEEISPPLSSRIIIGDIVFLPFCGE